MPGSNSRDGSFANGKSLDGLPVERMSRERLSVDLLSFAGPSVGYPGDLPAELVETGVVRLPDDGDTGLNHWLLGQTFFPEAFLTVAARDAKLGPAHQHIVFVPISWEQAEAGGASLADVAIGPALDELGFEGIAELVVPAKIERLMEFAFGGACASVSVVIARVDYIVRRDEGGALSVLGSPLYRAWSGEAEIKATMVWLLKAFAARLSSPRTPRGLLRRPRIPAGAPGRAF